MKERILEPFQVKDVVFLAILSAVTLCTCAVMPLVASLQTVIFGIAHLAERHPQSLSEGQKRRVSIAAVAASRPAVLLLDEPTVGQDYAGLKELVHMLNRLHEQSGSTMITITHDMRCAEALCDHAVRIAEGRGAEEGGKELARRYFYGAAREAAPPGGRRP